MHRDLEVRAAPAVPGLVQGLDLDLDLVVPVGLLLLLRLADLVGLMGPVVLLDRPVLGLAVRVVPEHRAILGPVDLVGLMVPAALLDRPDLRLMAPAALDPVDLMDRTGLVVPGALVGPVVQDRMDPVALMGLADPAVLMARVVPADRVVLNMADLAVPTARVVPADRVVPVVLNTAGLVAPVGPHRRHMCNRVTTTVVARSGVVRETHRTASAPQVSVRPHLRPRTDSGGMAVLLPERRRPTGTVHRLPAVGTVRRPPEAGTHAGTDRHTTSVGGRRTTARSTTTDTTPHRSSTRCSAAGASGSSVPGSRCTDLTPV